MSTNQDQRRHPRIAVPAESARVSMMLQSTAGLTIDQSEVTANDLSRTGMSFFRGQSVPDGTRCVVIVSQSGKSLRIIGKVTHCKPAEGKGYLVGVKFTNLQQLATAAPGVPLNADGIVDRLMVEV